LGHDRRRGARGLHHGAGDLRPRPAQRAGHRHVDLRRAAADHRPRSADPVAPLLQPELCMMAEKYAFRMKLNPGMKAEYRKRHDEIWPELVTLLRQAGGSDYSIHFGGEKSTRFGVA